MIPDMGLFIPDVGKVALLNIFGTGLSDAK